MKSLKQINEAATQIFDHYQKESKNLSDIGKSFLLTTIQIKALKTMDIDPVKLAELERAVNLVKGQYLVELEELDDY